MACVALASLKATIELEFLQPIPRVPLHDQAPIKCFLKRIFCLQAFLEESSGGDSATIKNLEIEIREFALKVEDDIEVQISNFLLAKDKECQEKASQELHQTLQEAAENAAELLKITESTSNEDDEDNETQQSMHRLKHASESENDKSNGSSPCSPKLVGRMVGRHHDHRKIVNMLERGFRDLSLVVIVGMVGIGKTTLAKSVYEDILVRTYFHMRIWITMPQEYNKDQILRLLLRSISPEAEKKIEKGSGPEELEGQVRSHLCGKRYLIVLDNLQDIWNDIRECFPLESNGSSILVTTTHLDRVLKLENALLEREWNVAEGEFCTLRFFLLEDTRLEQLKVDYRSFPSLKRIVLRFCCLQEIPRKFVENYELESTELNWCDSSIVDSAKRILQGRWNFGDYMLKIDGVIYEPPEYTRTNESVEEDLIGTGIGRTELFLLIIIFIYILHKLL